MFLAFDRLVVVLSVLPKDFHERARLCYADKSGHLVCWSRAEFFERVKVRQKTSENASSLQFDKILSVDKVHPNSNL